MNGSKYLHLECSWVSLGRFWGDLGVFFCDLGAVLGGLGLAACAGGAVCAVWAGWLAGLLFAPLRFQALLGLFRAVRAFRVA